MYLFLAVLGLHCCVDFSLVVGSRGYPSLQWLLLFVGSRAQTQLWRIGLVTLWHVGSFQTRDQICVSSTGRQILYH